ncbi:RNA polymerase sigma factor [Parabacteroides sp. Marseille-P3160]|uniref:RNA polymerase sigma factor n=1 Tax=Parabacteroides sp. Marseille-P3160 TaxID=1917887 RepID=UPI0009BB4C3A|nr:sigma factor [Parabacteroides sp. Marseille-P3160]
MKEERPSDLELDRAWKKFLAGDDESFNLLYNRYVQVLFSYGLQFISDRELLKDCIQDTFVKMYDAREHLHHVSNVNVYLRITLKNRLINILNRERMYSRIISIQDILPVDENTIEKHIVFEEEELQKQDKIEKMMNLLTA